MKTNIFEMKKQANKNTNIFKLTKKGKYEYKYIWIPFFRRIQIQIYLVSPSGIRKYEYKYKYSSHAGMNDQILNKSRLDTCHICFISWINFPQVLLKVNDPEPITEIGDVHVFTHSSEMALIGV